VRYTTSPRCTGVSSRGPHPAVDRASSAAIGMSDTRRTSREGRSGRRRDERYRLVMRELGSGGWRSGRSVEATPPAGGVASTGIAYFRLDSAKFQFTMFQKASTYFARALR